MTIQVDAQAMQHRALPFIKAQSSDRFQEALDIQVGLQGYPLLIGSVFQIGWIVLALQGAYPADAEAQRIVAEEVGALTALGDEAGWRYFNMFPDIPPDTDVLAQVMVVLHATGYPDRSNLLRGPLALLARNSEGPGRFRTWMAESKEAAREADARWLGGPDPVHPEVVANILFTLGLEDPDRFREDILQGLRWLASRQQDGLWASYWYYGHAYGTYQALRLFCWASERWPDVAAELAPTVQAAREALLNSQQSDGGWKIAHAPLGLELLEVSYELPPTPTGLETAWGLLALAQLSRDAEVGAAMERARVYLAGLQEADGGFQADPFYFTLGLEPYRSRTLTTAVVVMALLALRGHNGR